MANITSAEAVKFSNETARVMADALCRCYYFGNLAKQMYDGAGGGSTALAITGVVTQIRKAASQWRATFALAFEREAEWFSKGSTTIFPNDTSPVFDAGGLAQRSDVPLATGAKVVAVMARVTEWVNACRSATFSYSDAARNSVAKYNQLLVTSDRGLTTMSVADAQNFVDLTALLKTNYEANSLSNLNSLLAMAINPGTGG